MLSEPKFGWTSIEIESFFSRASYLTDIPTDCLSNMIIALKENIDFTLDCDAEGYTFKIVSDNESTYIIECKDGIKAYLFNKTKQDLAKEIYEDISNHLDAWCHFNTDSEEDNMFAIYRVNFIQYLNELKKLI